MEVGVLGEDAVRLVVLEFRQELVQILHQQMGVLSVLDYGFNGVTQKHVLVMNLIFFPLMVTILVITNYYIQV